MFKQCRDGRVSIANFKNQNWQENDMAFVNEAVPEDQKSIFDPKVFFNPNSAFRGPIELYRWTIDRERHVFLIRLGGGGPWEGGNAPKPKEYLALSWKGEVVKFEARVGASGNPEAWVADWEVLVVQIPQALEVHRDMVLQLIGEGLNAMGNSTCHREGATAVNVHFQ
jgi:hypothetical protein